NIKKTTNGTAKQEENAGHRELRNGYCNCHKVSLSLPGQKMLDKYLTREIGIRTTQRNDF
ncbi:MAG: hypothetical protein KGZ25_05820, partial [Planctomycetes bacterium]|nr:hypothetical protein [Planctomycetota bacterium]